MDTSAGALTEEHIRQIGAVFEEATNLLECTLTEENLGEGGLQMLWPQVELLCSKNRNFRLHVYGFGGECHYFSKTLEIKSCSSAEHACHVAKSTLVEEVILDTLTEHALQRILKVLMNREDLKNISVKNQRVSEEAFVDLSKVKQKFHSAKLLLENCSGSILLTLPELRANPLLPQLLSVCPKENQSDGKAGETGFLVRTSCGGEDVNLLESPLEISGASVEDVTWMFSLGHEDLRLKNPDFDVRFMQKCLTSVQRLRQRGPFKLRMAYGSVEELATGIVVSRHEELPTLPTGDAVLACHDNKAKQLLVTPKTSIQYTPVLKDTLSHLAIGLAAQNLGAGEVKAVAGNVVKLTNLSYLRLNLTCNNLGEKGGKALADGVGKLQNLSQLTLYLGSNNLGEEGGKAVATGVGKLQNLNHLTLYLGSNNLGEECGKAVATGVGKLQNLNHLTLNLEHNDLREESGNALAYGVGKLQNLNHLALYVRNINLEKETGKTLADGVGKLQNLNHLTLNLGTMFDLGEQGRAAVESIKQSFQRRGLDEDNLVIYYFV